MAAREGRQSRRGRCEIYELQLRRHILPAISDGVALGLVPLDELTPELIRAWYAALVAERRQVRRLEGLRDGFARS